MERGGPSALRADTRLIIIARHKVIPGSFVFLSTGRLAGLDSQRRVQMTRISSYSREISAVCGDRVFAFWDHLIGPAIPPIWRLAGRAENFRWPKTN
jgi:hypothetical protein